MVNVAQRSRELFAEITLRDRTGEGAESARKNIESVGEASEKTNAAVAKTEEVASSAERAYARLQARLDPLQKLQDRLARDEKALQRAREQGIIGVSEYRRNLKDLHIEYGASQEKLERLADTQKLAASAANDNAEAMRDAARAGDALQQSVVKHEASISSMADSSIKAAGSVAALGASVVGFATAKVEALDTTRKWSVALGLLGRILPIAGVAALGLALIKMGVDGVRAINSIIDSSVHLARVQREAEGQAIAAIASTGGAARRSIGDIRALAGEIQSLSNTADEVTVRAAAQLLTFTNIRGENFDRALRIGNDVAARLQRDPQQVALQIGKALNDPVRNLGALTESGIQFTDGQRNLIRSLTEVGEVATAQAIILAELENQFEGAARAQRLAEGGATALANAWGDLKEALGERIVERTADSTDRLARAVGDPAWKGFFRLIGDIIGGVRGFGAALKAAGLQGAADFIRGVEMAASATDRLLDRFETMIGFDLRGFFTGVAGPLGGVVFLFRQVNNLLETVGERMEGLQERLPAFLREDGPIRDYLMGGPVFGGANLMRGIGRRERERGETGVNDIDAAARGEMRDRDVNHRLEESWPAIIKHYQEMTAEAQKYYDVIKSGGAEALDIFQHEEEMRRRIAELTEGMPKHVKEAVEAEIWRRDEIERQTEAYRRRNDALGAFESVMERLNREQTALRERLQGRRLDFGDLAGEALRDEIEIRFPEFSTEQKRKLEEAALQVGMLRKEIAELGVAADETGPKLDRAFDPGADLARQNERLRDLVAAAEISREELERTEARFRLEDEIARMKAEAALAQRVLSEEELDNLREQLRENAKLRDRLDEAARRAGGEAGGGVFVRDLDRELDFVARDFTDELSRGAGTFAERMKRGLRDSALSLKEILLESVLDPFTNLLRDGLRNAFSPFTGGYAGGPNPAGAAGLTSFADMFGLSGSSLPGGVSSFVNQIPGLAAVAAIGSTISTGILDLFGVESRPARRAAGISGALIGGLPGAAIGGLVSLFDGKPSNRIGGLIFDPATGRTLSEGRKDDSEDALRNLELARELSRGVSDSFRRILDFTGGAVRDDPRTAAREHMVEVTVGNRNNILVGNPGAAGSGRRERVREFGRDDAGARDAIRYGLELSVGGIAGGDVARRAMVDELLALNEPVDRTIERLETLGAALDATDDPVHQFQRRLDGLRDAFDGLDVTTGALGEAYRKAVRDLSETVNRDNQRALQEFLNPVLARLNGVADELTSRRAALENIAGEGGTVDFRLLDDIERRTVLSQFNIEQRLARGADPARASIAEFSENQRREVEALEALVGRFGIAEADVAALRRAQVLERREFFRSIPDEDKLRLAGEGDGFLDLTDRYALTVDRLLEHTEKLVDGFEDRAQALRDVEARERAGAADYERSIRDLDRRFGQGDPAQRIGALRAMVEDFRVRALGAEDNEDRRLARDLLPGAVNDFIDLAQRAGASSPFAQEAVRFGRETLVDVREARLRDAEDAARSLAALEASRDALEDIRDILAAPDLDAARLAERAGGLPAGFDGRGDVLELTRTLLDIQQQRFEQDERIARALEALTPSDLGLGPDPAAAAAASTVATANGDGGAAPPTFTLEDLARVAPPQPQPAAASAPPGRAGDAAVIDALYVVARRLDAMILQDSEYYARQIDDNSKAERRLNTLANQA